MTRLRTQVLATWIAGLTFALAPLAATEDSLENLRQLVSNESWQEAVIVGRQLVEIEPAAGEAWLLLGQALRNSEQIDEAIEALQRGVELGYQPARSNATLAIAYSQAGEADRALVALQAAVEAGLPASVLETHPDLETLRRHPRFGELQERAERLSHPCEHDPKYAALDFWVGDWKVFMGDQEVGRNQITKLQRGCIIHESWTSASGGTGESINFYDPKTGLWRQHWVDESGGVVWYEGGPRGNGIHMVGENIDSKGTVKAARVSLTPRGDGTVHHLIEHSVDGGETWMVWFDAIYRPISAKLD